MIQLSPLLPATPAAGGRTVRPVGMETSDFALALGLMTVGGADPTAQPVVAATPVETADVPLQLLAASGKDLPADAPAGDDGAEDVSGSGERIELAWLAPALVPIEPATVTRVNAGPESPLKRVVAGALPASLPAPTQPSQVAAPAADPEVLQTPSAESASVGAEKLPKAAAAFVLPEDVVLPTPARASAPARRGVSPTLDRRAVAPAMVLPLLPGSGEAKPAVVIPQPVAPQPVAQLPVAAPTLPTSSGEATASPSSEPAPAVPPLDQRGAVAASPAMPVPLARPIGGASPPIAGDPKTPRPTTSASIGDAVERSVRRAANEHVATAPSQPAVAAPRPQPEALVTAPAVVAATAPVTTPAAGPQSIRRAADDPASLPGSVTQAGEALRPQLVAQTGQAQNPMLDMRRPNWPGRMVEHLEALREAGPAKETRIRLAPDALGSVDVAIRQEGDRIHVHFAAESAAARQLLTDAQPRLAEIAESRGVKLGQTSIDAGTGQSGSGQAQQQTPQQSAFRQSPRPAAAQAREREPQPDDRIA